MLKFTKMEGIGNDYIYFDGIHQTIPDDPHFIMRLSDRHTGVGSDGMIVILASETSDFKMRMFNADGSEGKMCGNGIRCFAKFVYDHHLTTKTFLEIETLSGVKKAWLLLKEGRVEAVRVDMGAPITLCKEIPVTYSKLEMINAPIEMAGHNYRCTAVSMGNPHVIMYVDDLDFDISLVGKQFEHAPMFPESVNTEFVKVINDKQLSMRVWERGSGETEACGTGACAVMYASYLNGKCGNEVDAKLLGGTLHIEYKEGTIFMTGPARTAYEGEIEEKEYV